MGPISELMMNSLYQAAVQNLYDKKEQVDKDYKSGLLAYWEWNKISGDIWDELEHLASIHDSDIPGAHILDNPEDYGLI